jgi:para-aminobenzoate synthetase/4-amino-4-deoxychorismate lyase
MPYINIPDEFYQLIEENNNAVLLETKRFDQQNNHSFLFLDPVDIMEIYHFNDLPDLFEKIEQYSKKNLYVSGYFSYECGYHFENIIDNFISKDLLAWFGVYQKPIIFNHSEGKFKPAIKKEKYLNDITGVNTYQIDNLKLKISRNNYYRKIDHIKNYIAAGDVYQINFTDKYEFKFTGSAINLYKELLKNQNVSYAAFIKNTHGIILSLSPELFFRMDKNIITAKPMKGTILRGKNKSEDIYLTKKLKEDEKSRAEMLMIVDLLRNDLGRISKINTINVKELFKVETYDTLHQMISTIKGELLSDVTYYDIFRALFPCGSVTGAPKIRAMQIIDQLEQKSRNIYTGSIGYFSPYKQAVFNVAIRTIWIKNGIAEMGTGSGIVWDSNTKDEYEECRLKAKFLSAQYASFQLIETLLWDGKYKLLDLHMQRLKKSAKEFGFYCPIRKIKLLLIQKEENFQRGVRYKVRILLGKNGYTKIASSVLSESKNKKLRIMLANCPVNSMNKYLYHKTTRRNMYNKYNRIAQDLGLADIIFNNEKREITEGTISNVIIKKNGKYYTPPVACGLLNGVYRRYFLSVHTDACEKILYEKELRNADTIYICNAIKGVQEVELVDRNDINDIK